MRQLHAYGEGIDIAVGKREALGLSLATYLPHGLDVIPEFGTHRKGGVSE